jgi:Peptidase family C25/Interleukin-like EMT inducer
MIKKLLVFSLILFSFISSKAQTFANGWINYSQNYYKIKVAQNGVYRVDSATLANAGIPVGAGGINPQNFQIFNKGAQQYIYVEGESDGVFNTGDFIEFYAQKNDGALDSLLYVNTPFVPNPYYSLINDTAVYFLTWNNLTSNHRMLPETDVNFNIPASNYFIKDEVQEYHVGYYEGETDFAGGTDVRYKRSEGWFDMDGNGDPLLLGATVTKSVNTKNVYSSGPNAAVRIVVAGASQNASSIIQGNPDHHITVKYHGTGGGYNAMIDDYFKGYDLRQYLYNLSPLLLGSAITDFQFQSLTSGISGFINDNRTAISFINVKYPHTSDLEGNNSFLMYVPNNSSQIKSYFHFSNFNASGTVRLYDLSNAKRITVVQNGSFYDALIPNGLGGNDKKCYITSDGNIINVPVLIPVTPNAQFTNFTASPVDSAYLIVTHKSLMSAVTPMNGYKGYRSSMSGGSQNVVVADIDELYDQFAYGIVKSPLSVRGFCNAMISANPSHPPNNLFLIGKSYHVALTRQNLWYYSGCLVPSFGNPSSDNLFTAGLTPGSLAPTIPTGRLSARNAQQVFDYLNKVQLFESPVNDTGDWKKQVLHFGGGSNAAEQSMFQGCLNSYASTIRNTWYGGNVRNFFKTSSAPIQINTSDTLRDLINYGVSIMTFFGHASGTSFDQSLDDINTYNPRPGHYPFLLANSCYAGDIHADGSTSENFVLTAQKGVIGYLGSVALGVSVDLNRYSGELYKQMAKMNYGHSIGSQIKQAITNVEMMPGVMPLDTMTCMEMTYHGDPALKINPGSKPDYKITGSDISFNKDSIPDTIVVSVVRTNIGKATNDSSITELIRTLPDGSSVTKVLINKEPYYRDIVKFKLAIDNNGVSGVGLNKFYITLDRNNTVDEVHENNNTTGEVDYIINGGDIIPVYPYNFAIVPTDTVTLKASTVDPMAASRHYIFQMDTTDTYNSPFRQTVSVTSVGGVVKWRPQNFITSTDSTVYFWRVSPDSISPTSGFKWHESSFQHVNGKKGWEQAHFFQYKNDGFQYVHVNRPQRKFEFYNDLKNIECTTGVPTFGEYKLNGYQEYFEPWIIPGLTFAVFDPINGNPKQSTDGPPNGGGHWGNVSGYIVGTRENAYDFYNYSDSLISNFINNLTNATDGIQTGDYVLAFTPGKTSPQYAPNIINAFHTLGASKIDTLHDNRPYILFGKKGGAQGSASEIIGDSANAIIHSYNTIITNWTKGYISSPVIGPATAWHTLHWRWKTLDGATTKDSIGVTVIGIKANGQEDVLGSFPKDSLDVLDLGGNYIPNASTYPYIRLVANMKDDSMHTAPQLKRWHVTFDPVPECAINPAIGGLHVISSQTVQEGDNFIVQLPIQNIGSVAFSNSIPFYDSLLITQYVVDGNGNVHHFPDKLKKQPFVPNQVIMDTVKINTYDNNVSFKGNNALWVEVNPLHRTHSQLEQTHFNNIVRIPFQVSGDRVNPLLDVTFDGVHILNADIVSAKPNIMMKLKDENQFLALNDTNDFKVFLQTPSSSTIRRVWFGQNMTFVPAVLPNNSCRINFTPVFTQDGTYQLLVQAKDVSNNLSGAVDYKISFEVINKASITEVMNYPNPFTTSTRFVFTLTGSELPSNFKIQIMTISGKVVKEIFEEELGMIHIGRNITEYAWDGRDQYGDRLANGVYLYRVITKLNGEDMDKRETDADQYFKKGWGKMYLMR